jgi:hypothetical protein
MCEGGRKKGNCSAGIETEQRATRLKSNWLDGTLSGPKRPIFRHTLQIFLTVALLWPTKIHFVWQKMATFLSQTRPR